MSGKILAIIFIFSAVTLSTAQSPLIKQWDKRYGGVGRDVFRMIEQTADGGYILGGESESGNTGDKSQTSWGYVDYWIVKLDSSGNKVWDKRLGGDNMDNFASLTQTKDGGYLVGGTSGSQLSGDKTYWRSGLSDFWIVKIDSAGNKLWDKQFGGNKIESMSCLTTTAYNGYVLGGMTGSSLAGDITVSNWDPTLQTVDYWIIQIDSAGNKEWDKRFGGTKNDLLKSIYPTADKGFILGGVSESGVNGDKTQGNWSVWHDHWLVKIDSAGSKQWDKRLGTSEVDEFIKVIQTNDYGYILIANSSAGIDGDKSDTSKGGEDYWVIKLDSLGNKLWDKTYGSSGKEEVFNIVQTHDGGYLVSGDSYSPIGGDKTEANLGYEQIWLVKIDSIGTVQWDKTILTLGHDEVGYAIQTGEGAFVMAEFTNGDIGGQKTQTCWDTFDLLNPVGDYWIVKYQDTTKFCHLLLDTIISDNTEGCVGDSISLCAPIGFLNYTWSNGKTTNCINVSATGSYSVTVTDVNLCTATSNEIPIYIHPLPLVSVYRSNDTLIAPSGLNYQWYFDDNIIVGAISNSYLATQEGIYTVIVTDSNGCAATSNAITITSIEEIDGNNIQVYPNPVTKELNLKWRSREIDEVMIYNLEGQLVYRAENPTGNRIDVSQYDSGMYVAEVRMKNRVEWIRWIKK